MSAFIQILGWALVHALWQGCLLALLAFLFGFVLSGVARHRMHGLILFLCLLLPAATAWHWHRPAPLQIGWAHEGNVQLEIVTPRLLSVPSPPRPLLARLETAVQPHLPRLVALWMMGFSLMALRFGGGLALSQHWKRKATPAPAQWQAVLDRLARKMGLQRGVRLLLSTRGHTPLAMGLWKPVVMLPVVLLTNLPPEYLEALLAHELAHVRRLDYFANLLQGIVETLLFFHPAIWWLSARIRAEREELADDLAAQVLGDPRCLALALNELDDFQPTFHPPLFPALAARGGHLLSRIERLLSPKPNVGSHWGILSLLLLPGAVLVLRAAVPNQPAIPAPVALVAQLDALAAKEGLDPQLLRSMAWVESGFSSSAKSPMGATGLLQVMPETARAYGAKDLDDPAQVMAAGAKYMRFLLAHYQGDLPKAVAAYNCGEKALDGGRITEEATRYRALVLDVMAAKAVQPETPLAEGEVQAVIRMTGDKMQVQFRCSTQGNLNVDLLSAKDASSLGAIRIGEKLENGGFKTGPWAEYRPKVVVKAPGTGVPLLLRCEDPGTGWRGEARIQLDAPWKTVRFLMEKPKL